MHTHQRPVPQILLFGVLKICSLSLDVQRLVPLCKWHSWSDVRGHTKRWSVSTLARDASRRTHCEGLRASARLEPPGLRGALQPARLIGFRGARRGGLRGDGFVDPPWQGVTSDTERSKPMHKGRTVRVSAPPPGWSLQDFEELFSRHGSLEAPRVGAIAHAQHNRSPPLEDGHLRQKLIIKGSQDG